MKLSVSHWQESVFVPQMSPLNWMSIFTAILLLIFFFMLWWNFSYGYEAQKIF